MSKSSVATRRGAAGAIINAAKKNMDQAMFGGCWGLALSAGPVVVKRCAIHLVVSSW